MFKIISARSKKFNREVLKEMLLKGKGQEVEEEIFSSYEQEAVEYYQELVNEVSESEAGKEVVLRLTEQEEYRAVKRVGVRVKIKGGHHVQVRSWYGLAKNKKPGPFKKGPNGTGSHILLKYWGYMDKWSPCYAEEVVRSGVSSISYDMSEAELKERGIVISSNSVDHTVQKVGSLVQENRGELPIELGESLAGKRVVISLDGGRVRTREMKFGRQKKSQKGRGFNTPWKEPKLLVIAELDERGKKKRDTKSIYEATMKGPEELFQLLVMLCKQLDIHKAAEIVYLGDGGPWIWNLFQRLSQELQIGDKVTEIIDWCHAVEHLYDMAGNHQEKSEEEQVQWANQLKPHLMAGKLDLLTHLVDKEKDQIENFDSHWNYFIKHRERMRYDQFKAARLPIGSGIVESAIKRVINSRIKSTGSYWKVDNVENMLPLRCALLSGRWRTYMDNFRQLRSLRLNQLST